MSLFNFPVAYPGGFRRQYWGATRNLQHEKKTTQWKTFSWMLLKLHFKLEFYVIDQGIFFPKSSLPPLVAHLRYTSLRAQTECPK